MRKIILGALATLFLVGGAFGTQAAPGPNDNNNKGLCTAYFNGQKNGHDKDGDGRSKPGPFYNLEDAAGAEEGDSAGEVAYAVSQFCTDVEGNSIVGGNPEHGRYDCGEDAITDQDEDEKPECASNPAPNEK